VVRNCAVCSRPFNMLGPHDTVCPDCDAKAIQQYANGEPIDNILAWYPLTLGGLRERASQARRKRGYPCKVCGKTHHKPGVCTKCRKTVLLYAAQNGATKAAKKYRLSVATVYNMGREFLGGEL